jgi:hypothetical protein
LLQDIEHTAKRDGIDIRPNHDSPASPENNLDPTDRHCAIGTFWHGRT